MRKLTLKEQEFFYAEMLQTADDFSQVLNQCVTWYEEQTPLPIFNGLFRAAEDAGTLPESMFPLYVQYLNFYNLCKFGFLKQEHEDKLVEFSGCLSAIADEVFDMSCGEFMMDRTLGFDYLMEVLSDQHRRHEASYLTASLNFIKIQKPIADDVKEVEKRKALI